MLRVGVGPIAAGVAAFAIGFGSYLWLTIDRAPANAGSRAGNRALSALGTVDPRLPGRSAGAVGADTAGSFHARWASLEAEVSARSSFGERFSLDQADEPRSALQLSASFDDRFGSELTASVAGAPSAAAPARSTVQRVATAAKPPAAARSAAAQAAPKRATESRMRLASASTTSLPLAYAPTDSVKTSAVPGAALKELTPKASKPLDPARTAIYDISSRTVYLPNGRRLEAHSGLGDHMDDPRYVNVRMSGPTPPNVYDLKMRESLFHGVRAIRLVPTDETKMYGRAGILAHSYLLGPSGASNGCVSFADYGAFLDAFQRGEIDRLVVVDRLDNPPSPRTAADWFKDLFRGS